jgi:hypothetical protein
MIGGATLRFAQVRTVIDQAAINRHVETAGQRGLGRVGGVLRQEARKSVKRRVVTDAMRGRLRDAKTPTAKRRILETIQRRQSQVSSPGDPPVAHVPDHPVASIRAIYFAVDGKAVTVGPVLANQVSHTSAGTLPELLEFGGTGTVHEQQHKDLGDRQPGPWMRATSRNARRPWLRYRTRSTRYAARPFMGPTLSRSQAAVRKILASTFRRAG